MYEARAGVPVAALAADAARLVREPLDLAHACADDAGLGRRTGIDRDAIALSYPTWLLELLVEDHGRDAALALAAAMNTRAPLAVRVNTARVSRDELAARLAEEHVVAHPTPLSPVGLVFETRVNAFALSAFKDGLFEVMDEGSQLVAELVAPPPGGRVADACAGAGGKTLAIAAALAGKGRVLALDTHGAKLEELRRRARRAGLTNVEAKPIKDDPAELAKLARGRLRPRVAGRAVLGAGDAAPQSRGALAADARRGRDVSSAAAGAGDRLRAADGGRRAVDLRDLHGHARRKRGRDRALSGRARRLRAVPAKEIWGRERAERLGDGMTLRLSPDRHDTDGFFAAVLRRVR